MNTRNIKESVDFANYISISHIHINISNIMLRLGIHLCKMKQNFIKLHKKKKKKLCDVLDVGGQERKDSLRQLNAFGPCMWIVCFELLALF